MTKFPRKLILVQQKNSVTQYTTIGVVSLVDVLCLDLYANLLKSNQIANKCKKYIFQLIEIYKENITLKQQVQKDVKNNLSD